MKIDLQKEFLKQMNENQRIVHKICKIYTDNPEDHEDLFQEIVIQLWKAYPQFRGDAKFSTWMYKIGLNTALALFKKKSRSITMEGRDTMEQFKIIDDSQDHETDQIQAMYDAIHQLQM